MEAVEEQAQATEEKQGTVKITVCLSLSGVAEGGPADGDSALPASDA